MSEVSVRPAGVTVVAVVAWISGALEILGGIILLFQAGDESVAAAFGGSGGLWAAAIGSIIIGIVIVVVAFGLLRGNTAARMIVTVVEVLSIIGSLFLAFAYLGSAVGEWAGIVVSLIVLLLLWTRRASAFFNS
ncbi:DUF7144 family membrane protein [Agromyces ramosus]|uniref:DUF7144 domain-containing protein n=1 Tax=Agromyces ramosus TaxID=33879 RepID=A0ABU0R5L4_9MICO|nr:hypothetical protein [Agromyces ramosus]MDQ0893371.1 hypothetical protein [Agromyces ramosus]